MSSITDQLVKDTPPSRVLLVGRVSKVDGANLYAVIPTFNLTHDFGPMPFVHAGDVSVGDSVLVGFDEQGASWVVGWTGSLTTSPTVAGIPAGLIAPFSSDTIPDGWLLCDGSAVSRTTYADLFAAIGSTYGDGNGTTTFNLPNAEGRVLVGKDGATFAALGDTGGEETHNLISGEMPSHTHAFTGTALGTHSHASTASFAGSAMGTHTHTFTGDALATHSHASTAAFTGTAMTAHTHSDSAGTPTTSSVGIESANHTHSGTVNAETTDHTHLSVNSSPSFKWRANAPTSGSGKVVSDVGNTTGSGDPSVANPNTGGRSSSHTHAFSTGTVSANHTHTVTMNAMSAHSHSDSAGTPAGTVTITPHADSAGTPSGSNSSDSAGTPAGTVTITPHSDSAGTPAGTVTITPHADSAGTPAGSNANTGGDGAHNNLQPYLTVNYIVKT